MEQDREVAIRLGDEGACNVIKEFLAAEVIARRPAYSPLFDNLEDALLHFVVRFCRQSLAKSTSNVENIERICDKELDLLLPLVQSMAEHMNHSGVSMWGCWMFAVLASDSPERQIMLSESGAAMV